MPPVTRIALKALEMLGGPRVLLAAVPGGIGRLAKAAGVSEGRVSQVLRQEHLPRSWADLIASLSGFTVSEIYVQLGQTPVGSPLGPLFDESVGTQPDGGAPLPSPTRGVVALEESRGGRPRAPKGVTGRGTGDRGRSTDRKHR